MNCADCRYSHDTGVALLCWGQRFAPPVDREHWCEGWKPIGTKPLTHFDEIKAMSAEEFSEWISHIVGCPLNNFLEYSPIGKCVKKCTARSCWLAWLKAAADKEGEG